MGAGVPDGDERMLLDWLRQRDAPCPVCRYNVRGVVEPVCPECGAELQLAVASPRTETGPWLLAIVSFALALGFDGVLLLVLGGMLVFGLLLVGPAGPAPWLTVAAFALLTVLSGLGFEVLRRHRLAWMRLSAASQRRLALWIFLGVGLFHALAGAWLSFYLL